MHWAKHKYFLACCEALGNQVTLLPWVLKVQLCGNHHTGLSKTNTTLPPRMCTVLIQFKTFLLWRRHTGLSKTNTTCLSLPLLDLQFTIFLTSTYSPTWVWPILFHCVQLRNCGFPQSVRQVLCDIRFKRGCTRRWPQGGQMWTILKADWTSCVLLVTNRFHHLRNEGF